MTEETFWANHVKPALTSTHFHRRAWKVGTSTRAGIPDVAYRPARGMAWLELKYIPHWPVRSTTPLTLGLTTEQQAHLRDWCEDERGNGFVVALVETDVFVFPWHVPNIIERDNVATSALLGMALSDVKNLLGRQLDELILPKMSRIQDATWVDLGETYDMEDEE